MQVPPPLSQYVDGSKEALDAIREVQFSEGTYLIECFDREKDVSYWPFLRFDDGGKLLDFFCSCPSSESSGACPHLAAAFLRVTQPTLLHVRYKRSFWYALFFSLARSFGYHTNLLTKEGDSYQLLHQSGCLFSATPTSGLGEAYLRSLIEERVQETEDTSIKFSNLSLEEIENYREGRASPEFRFELSFWSDLAKWCFLVQDAQASYKVAFPKADQQLPNRVLVTFPDVRYTSTIEAGNWPFLIEALRSIHSPIGVQIVGSLERITYDATHRRLLLEKTPHKLQAGEGKEVAVGTWFYTPGRGFFTKGNLLGRSFVEEEDLDAFLTEYPQIVDEHLQGAVLQKAAQKLQYELKILYEEGLLITAYLDHPGDLLQECAALFSSYAYLPGTGFIPIEGKLFPKVRQLISLEELSDFVTHHRSWLHQFSGFQTHLGSLEAQFRYQVDQQGTLSFHTKFTMGERLLDVGVWIYIEGEGFFRKKGGKERFVLRSGAKISADQIPRFLDEYREELLDIPQFFLESSPLLRSGLDIFLSEQGQICVTPQRAYASGIEERDVSFFGHYAYVQGRGFFPVAAQLTLPDPFIHSQIIPKVQEEFFLQYELERIKAFIFSLDPRLKKPQQLQLKVRSMKKERKRGKDVWLVDLYYESEIGLRSAMATGHAVLAQKQYDYSPAGLLYLQEGRFNWLRALGKKRLQKKQVSFRLTTIEWMRLAILENIQEPEGDSAEEMEVRKWMRSLSALSSERLIDLSGLQSTLRPYQEKGLQWLWFLYCHGLSGLLCDEMGLGKTHQAMALLAAAFEENRRAKFLVVCPTSVIYHWQDLLARFLPKIRVLTYYGLERSLEGFLSDYDLLLTSYGILRTGKENLGPYSFSLAIFDEIQVAKNHTSQTHFALANVQATMRLGLTGTPIENRLRELKALFDLVLPGYLPPEKEFRELFILPIEKQHDPDKKVLLQTLVKPFILRRKKSSVLRDLPEKIEEISYLDLSDEQRTLYQEIAREKAPQILDRFSENRKAPYTHIFSLLSHLKQVCDHPSLIHGDLAAYDQHASGKWEFFKELLADALASEQKVVVFSQYLGMLSIIEKYLKKQGIGFTTIRGATKNRKEALQRFREDPSCQVFVASLLAAGVGIDLSSASIVIHYDRWWNPAKEDQATDRVHRMGQSRGVHVFKLVTKETIEEDIHRMIDAKRHLVESSIGKHDGDHIPLLSKEDLLHVIEKTVLL